MNIKKRFAEVLEKLPDSPGVYFFYNSKSELIYVGKATSLKNRVKSYFALKNVSALGSPNGRQTPPNLPLERGGGRPIEEMIHEVVNINWQETDSVLEAIILEANQIKKYLPKYNVLGKDDKSWNYIVITKDRFPKVLTAREHEFSVIARSEATSQSPGFQNQLGTRKRGSPRPFGARDDAYKYVFGPYPGLNTAATMKLLRRIFRF